MKDIDEKGFNKEVLEEEGLVLVDFYADWCGPCQMMKPVLEEFADANKDLKVLGVNIDDNEDLAEEYEVSTIPCMVLFKKGEEVAREIAVVSPKKLKKMVEKANGL